MTESKKLTLHRNYTAHAQTYKDISAAKIGGLVTSQYITQYSTEKGEEGSQDGEKIFANRLARTYNINVTNPTIIQHRASLAQPIDVTGFESTDKLLEDVDGQGNSASKIYRDTLDAYLTYGFCGRLVETPVSTAANRKQEVEQRIRPYQQLYGPLEILNWQFFSDVGRQGQLEEIWLLSAHKKVDGKWRASVRQYVFPEDSATYVAQDWISKSEHKPNSPLNDIDIEPDGDPRSGRERIPFVMFGEGPQDSVVCDVFKLNIAITNRISVLSNVLYNQGFQRSVAVGVDGSKPEGLKKIGEMIMGWISTPGAKIETIPAGEAKALFEELRMLFNWAKRIGGKQWNQMLDDSSKQVQSAESKAKDLIVLQNFYDETADMFELREGRVYRHMARAANKNLTWEQAIETVRVTIGRDFGLVDREMQALVRAQALQIASKLDDETELEIIKVCLKPLIADMHVLPGDDGKQESERRRIMDLIDKASLKSLRGGTGANKAAQFLGETPVDETDIEANVEEGADTGGA